jgi:hypothetical protein
MRASQPPCPEPDLSHYGIQTEWLHQQPRERRLLVIYAHPDDESFGNAGTIVRYSAEGVAVHYACATRGECRMFHPRGATVGGWTRP